jgi:hypothetical protein
MTTRHQRADVTSSRGRDGVADVSGWGLLGLTVGVLSGFLLGCFQIVPLFPPSNSPAVLTMMTTAVVGLMTVGGAVGYLVSRRSPLVART